MEIALACTSDRLNADASLVWRMAAGDEGALRALYAAYGRRVLAYAYRLTDSRLLAEEVVQDTLLAAWQGARRFRGDSRVLTWLLGIAHRQALNATRRKRLFLLDLEKAAPVADRVPGPQAQAEGLDRRRVLQGALGELSANHQAVLELVFYQELSLKEAAEVCGCPVGTVKSRLSYAKAHLREALTRAGLQAEDVL
jgi:RNA polymerase sigma-70 factor (ECF subfamily)